MKPIILPKIQEVVESLDFVTSKGRGMRGHKIQARKVKKKLEWMEKIAGLVVDQLFLDCGFDDANRMDDYLNLDDFKKEAR